MSSKTSSGETAEQKQFAKRINFNVEDLKRLYYDLHGIEHVSLSEINKTLDDA